MPTSSPRQFRDDQRIVLREDVLSRVLDGEAVLLDLKSGTYFGLNEVGTEIWRLFDGGATVGEVRAELLDRYDVDEGTAQADLDCLIAELVARGLATVTE